jgi:predicted chitinase
MYSVIAQMAGIIIPGPSNTTVIAVSPTRPTAPDDLQVNAPSKPEQTAHFWWKSQQLEAQACIQGTNE